MAGPRWHIEEKTKSKSRSTSEWIAETVTGLTGFTPRENQPFQLQLDAGLALTNLFALGRIIALLQSLSDTRLPFQLEIQGTKRRIKTLEAIGLLSYLESCGVNLKKIHRSEQLQFSSGGLAGPSPKSIDPRLLEQPTYWIPVFPFMTFDVKGPGDEQSASDETESILKRISERLQQSFADVYETAQKASIPVHSLGIEISRFLYGIIDELVNNAVRHSHTRQLGVCLTLRREVNPDVRAGRSGHRTESGIDQFEFLVMDFGVGLAPSIAEELGLAVRAQDGYRSLTPWKEDHTPQRKHEEALLTTVFDGGLVVRRGRRSEGLHELWRSLAWFQGILNYASGRTEVQLVTDGTSRPLSIRNRSHAREYNYLPGVIASGALPSIALSSLSSRLRAREINRKTTVFDLRHFSTTPPGLLGTEPHGTSRRQSELDAHNLVREATAAERDSSKAPILWELNLRLAPNTSIDYLDTLLQELTKIANNSGHLLVSRLVFNNVSRSTIFELQRRNAAAFLMRSSLFAVFLDECGEPHFIGVPRLSRRSIDTEAVLRYIAWAGSATAGQLRAKLKVKNDIIEFLASYRNFGPAGAPPPGEITFQLPNLFDVLERRWKRSVSELKKYYLVDETRPANTAYCRLRNGIFLDSSFDFDSYWSDSRRVWDVAQYLLSRGFYRPVETILSFADNGDRLAAVMQRITNAPNLIILRPDLPEEHDSAGWSKLRLRGSSNLVLDALFPNDENGYLGTLLRHPSEAPANLIIFSLYVGFNFHGSKQFESALFEFEPLDLPLPPPEVLRQPRPCEPGPNVRILGATQHFPKALWTHPPAESSARASFLRWSLFSPTEISTEFWHNVSVLGLLNPRPASAEGGRMLFVADTTILIRHARMRKAVSDFVSRFVRNTLHSNIDVIVFPSHSTDCFLAQLVADQVIEPPLQIALVRSSSLPGLEISDAEITSYQVLLRRRLRQRLTPRGSNAEDDHPENISSPLRAVILCDTLTTGSALFSMLGLCARLRIRVAGMLALMSRLTPEVTEHLRRSNVPSEVMFPLHMPVFTADGHPDQRLRRLIENFRITTLSYAGRFWAQKIKLQAGHFRWDTRYDEPNQTAPVLSDGLKAAIDADDTACSRAKFVIVELLFHRDCDVIDFGTRLAVVHNFVPALIEEPLFWRSLLELADEKLQKGAAAFAQKLLEKIVYMLAFTRHVGHGPAFENFEKLCVNVINLLRSRIELDSREEDFSLLAECICALGVVNSTRVLMLGADAVLKCLPSLEFSPAGNGRNQLAWEVVGSFAWSSWRVLNEFGIKAAARELGDAVTGAHSTEQPAVHFGLIDALHPFLSSSPELREACGIAERSESDELLAHLSQDDNASLAYLCEAPGYVCTLKAVAKICKATTVLLYFKSSQESSFRLLTMTSRGDRPPADSLEHSDVYDLSARVTEVAGRHIFLYSDEQSYLNELDKFVKGEKHSWSFGAPIQVLEGEISYFAILGFSVEGDIEFRATAFYYWLQCQSFLRKVLLEIHGRYLASASARYALARSLGPIHRIHERKSDIELVNLRRAVLRKAIAKIDWVAILRRAVHMATESVYKITDLFERPNVVIAQLRKWVDAADEPVAIERAGLVWPAVTIDLQGHDTETFISAYQHVLDVVLTECISNALAYAGSFVEITIKTSQDPAKRANREILDILISNDRAGDPSLEGTGKGLNACRGALAAVEGTFQSSELGEIFNVHITLPIYIVPAELRLHLGEYL